MLISVLEEEKLVVIGVLKMVFVWEVSVTALMVIMELIVQEHLALQEIIMILPHIHVYLSVLADIIKIYMIYHVKNVIHHVNNASENLKYAQDVSQQLKIHNIFMQLRINAIVYAQPVLLYQSLTV